MVALEQAFQTDYCIEFEQRDGRRRIVEVEISLFELINKRLRQGVEIHFQAKAQRSGRTNARSNTTEIGALDCLVKLKSATPKSFVAKSVKAKCIAALCDHLVRIRNVLRIKISQPLYFRMTLRRRNLHVKS